MLILARYPGQAIHFTIPPSDVEREGTIIVTQISKTPARHIDPIRARRTSRNQLQFDFDFESPSEA